MFHTEMYAFNSHYDFFYWSFRGQILDVIALPIFLEVLMVFFKDDSISANNSATSGQGGSENTAHATGQFEIRRRDSPAKKVSTLIAY